MNQQIRMRRSFGLVISLSFLLVTAAFAQLPEKETPAELKEAVGKAEALGQALYARYQNPETEEPGNGEKDLKRQAVELAFGSVKDFCDAGYRAIVLDGKAAGQDGYLVYLIGSTTKTGEIMFGRHYRVEVDKSASKVVSVSPLSKTCLIIPSFENTKIAGGKPLGPYVTHLLSPAPNEIHVFLSLEHRMPIFVGTSGGVWLVEKGKIRYLGPPKQIKN